MRRTLAILALLTLAVPFFSGYNTKIVQIGCAATAVFPKDGGGFAGIVKIQFQPKIQIDSFDEGKDLTYTISFEVLPDVTPCDFKTITVERLVVEPTDAEFYVFGQLEGSGKPKAAARAGKLDGEFGHSMPK